MSIGLLSKGTRRRDTEARRIWAVIEHIEGHGNLDGFPAGRGERVALMSTADRQGLVVWDKRRGCYGLTGAGKGRLRVGRRALRTASQQNRVRTRWRLRSGASVLIAGALAAACAGLILWLPSGFSTRSAAPQAASSQAAGSLAAGPSASTPAAAREEPKPVEHAADRAPTNSASLPGTIEAAVQPEQAVALAAPPTQTPPPAAKPELRRDVPGASKRAHPRKRNAKKSRQPGHPEFANGMPYGYGSSAYGRSQGSRSYAW